MRVARIHRIQNHHIFRKCDWRSLPQFQKFNLIYGFNGTGKTTLSNLFRSIELGEDIVAEKLLIETSNGRTFTAKDIREANLQVRVFNRDYVSENIFAKLPAEGLEPIVILGRDSISKQTELTELREKREQILANKTEAEKMTEQISKYLDRRCTDWARAIKERLRSNAETPYNSYNRTHFKKMAEEMAVSSDLGAYALPEERVRDMVNFTRQTHMQTVSGIEIESGTMISLASEIADVCSAVTDRPSDLDLANSTDLSKWLEQGLDLHRNKSQCTFCAQPLCEERLATLHSHFNSEHTVLHRTIGEKLMTIERLLDKLEDIRLPPALELHPEVSEDYRRLKVDFQFAQEGSLALLEEMKDQLETKLNHMSRALEIRTSPISPFEDLEKLTRRVNAVLNQHNYLLQDHLESKRGVRSRVEKAMVSEVLNEYLVVRREINKHSKAVQHNRTELQETQDAIDELEAKLQGNRCPAEELNEDLSRYLGHSDIEFEPSDTGYKVSRHGDPVVSMSESERTAISFLYFLKTLSAEDFDLENAIIIIDDPISSLDSISMYHAAAFIRNHLRMAGQVFILTHNHDFLRHMKSWFGTIDHAMTGYFMLQLTMVRHERHSNLSVMHPLLRESNQEYLYLLRLLRQASELSMDMPYQDNLHGVAFLTIERFLAWKHPKGYEIEMVMESLGYDRKQIEEFLTLLVSGPETASDAQFLASQALKLIHTVDADLYGEMIAKTY